MDDSQNLSLITELNLKLSDLLAEYKADTLLFKDAYAIVDAIRLRVDMGEQGITAIRAAIQFLIEANDG